jgi:hypothetical protein
MNEHEAFLHRRAWDAIPWVVAGAASTEELRCVEEHLARCSECQAEWALQQRVHAGRNASQPADEALPESQAGWRALTAGLTADHGVATALRPPSAPALPGLGRSTGPRPAAAASGAGAAAGAPLRWMRWLVAAVVVQAVGLGAVSLALLDHGRDADADPRLLSQAPAAPAAAQVRVVPAPNLNFAELRQLLAQTHMVAVDVGPDGGSLGLAAADGDPGTVATALPLLRASPLLMLVEPGNRSR